MIDESKINVGKCYDAEPIQHKAIWNEAIEAAANSLRMNSTGNWIEPYLIQIKKLKK